MKKQINLHKFYVENDKKEYQTIDAILEEVFDGDVPQLPDADTRHSVYIKKSLMYKGGWRYNSLVGIRFAVDVGYSESTFRSTSSTQTHKTIILDGEKIKEKYLEMYNHAIEKIEYEAEMKEYQDEMRTQKKSVESQIVETFEEYDEVDYTYGSAYCDGATMKGNSEGLSIEFSTMPVEDAKKLYDFWKENIKK